MTDRTGSSSSFGCKTESCVAGSKDQSVTLQNPQIASRVWTIPEGQATELPSVQESDMRDDSATQRLLYCLRLIGQPDDPSEEKNKDDKQEQNSSSIQTELKTDEKTGIHKVVNESLENRAKCMSHSLPSKEGMVVISRLEFRRYLDDKTEPINAAVCSAYPRPIDRPAPDDDGDLDVLVVHSQLGLILVEVKAFGAHQENITEAQFIKVIHKALQQLRKGHDMLKYITNDLKEEVNITKSLVLPFVTRFQLESLVDSNEKDSIALVKVREEM